MSDELFMAVENNNFNVVKRCVENGCDVNVQDKFDENTPLMKAILNNNFDIIKFLVEHNANVNIKNKNSETPLMFAVKYATLDVVKYIFEHHANINAKDKNNETCLFIATKYNSGNQLNRLEKFKYLVERSGNLNVKNKDGYTPLMMAAKYNKFDLIKQLIKYGARVNIKNDYNETAIDIAIKNDNFKLADYLEEYESDSDCDDSEDYFDYFVDEMNREIMNLKFSEVFERVDVDEVDIDENSNENLDVDENSNENAIDENIDDENLCYLAITSSGEQIGYVSSVEEKEDIEKSDIVLSFNDKFSKFASDCAYLVALCPSLSEFLHEKYDSYSNISWETFKDEQIPEIRHPYKS